ATWIDGKAMLTDVRHGSSAERAGLAPGDEILMLNGKPVAAASAEFEPRFLSHPDPAARVWALTVALAGRHEQKLIRLQVKSSSGVRDSDYAPTFEQPSDLLAANVVDHIGHIRIHNSLGNQSLVKAFDDALLNMVDATALVIDLRDTPSGGISSVARGILGRF